MNKKGKPVVTKREDRTRSGWKVRIEMGAASEYWEIRWLYTFLVANRWSNHRIVHRHRSKNAPDSFSYANWRSAEQWRQWIAPLEQTYHAKS